MIKDALVKEGWPAAPFDLAQGRLAKADGKKSRLRRVEQ